MSKQRKLKPRPTYRQRSQADINAEIKRACAPGTALYDYFIEEALQENFGANEFDRGVIEGGRRFAIRFVNIALDEGSNAANAQR